MDILNKTKIQNKILRAPEFGGETGEGGASSTSSNAIFIGGVEVDKFYLGNSDDVKIYLGDTLLYPQTLSYKLIAQYSDATEYKVECDGGTALTQSMVEGHTTPKSAMTSADIGGCGMLTFKVGDNSFSGASSLTSVTIDDSVSEFGTQAFIHTEALREMSFPSGLTKIGTSCFRFSGIRKFNNKIPSGVTYLNSGAFADMYSLSAITIPSSVTGSLDNLFLRDSGLTQVHFEGETAPELGANAFKNCSALIKIYIPSCDCYDSYKAQSQFSGLTSIIYAEGTNTKCEPYAPSIKMAKAYNWTYSVDTNSNVYHIQKSASSTGELTTCSIVVSGITSIVFKISFSNNSSGIRFSSSKDNYASGTTLKTVNSTWTLSGLTSSSSYTIRCQLIKRSGTYVTGTAAGADITWTQ